MFCNDFLYDFSMKCPNCSVEAPAGAADCAACGVIFAKFKKKLENLSAPSAPMIRPWLGRWVAAAIVVTWMVALGLYYHRALSRPPVRVSADPAPLR
jgi:hypothetical protein